MKIKKSQIVNGRICLARGQKWVAYLSNAAAWNAAKAYNAKGLAHRDGAKIAKVLESMKAAQ